MDNQTCRHTDVHAFILHACIHAHTSGHIQVYTLGLARSGSTVTYAAKKRKTETDTPRFSKALTWRYVHGFVRDICPVDSAAVRHYRVAHPGFGARRLKHIRDINMYIFIDQMRAGQLRSAPLKDIWPQTSYLYVSGLMYLISSKYLSRNVPQILNNTNSQKGIWPQMSRLSKQANVRSDVLSQGLSHNSSKDDKFP